MSITKMFFTFWKVQAEQLLYPILEEKGVRADVFLTHARAKSLGIRRRSPRLAPGGRRSRPGQSPDCESVGRLGSCCRKDVSSRQQAAAQRSAGLPATIPGGEAQSRHNSRAPSNIFPGMAHCPSRPKRIPGLRTSRSCHPRRGERSDRREHTGVFRPQWQQSSVSVSACTGHSKVPTTTGELQHKSGAAKRDWRTGNDTKIWLGNEKRQCVSRFFFVQPRVISMCNVTERISFVNFLLQFSERAFLNLFGFSVCWINFEARFDCWLFEQSLVCHFLENSTPAPFPTPNVLQFCT